MPSASHRRHPAARSTTIGVPPTAPKARTGLSTPPTRTARARSKICCERGLSRSAEFIALRASDIRIALEERNLPPTLACLEPSRDVLSVIRKNNFRSSSLDAREHFQCNALFVEPAVPRRRFHHRVLAAHVISRHWYVKAVAHLANDVQ